MIKTNRMRTLLAAALLLLTLLLIACAANVGAVRETNAAAGIVEANVDATDQEEMDVAQNELEDDENVAADDAEGDGPTLATASVVSRLSNQAGRAIVSARGNHFVVDSVPPLDNPSEELNPLDMMLSSLATCGIFVAEKTAEELNIPLRGALATVEGDFNPAGVASSDVDVNPRIQSIRVYLDLVGTPPGRQRKIVEAFQARCPIYTTLSRAANVEIFTDGEPGTESTDGLATATATAMLSNQPGRAIVSARGNHFVVDSVPPLDGPNEERNPLDLMLGALATCGTFIYEHVSVTEGIPLTAIAATVEGDFYPAGVATGDPNPRLRAFRVQMQLSGATQDEANLMAAEFEARCPIYTTLVRAAPIEITTVLDQ